MFRWQDGKEFILHLKNGNFILGRMMTKTYVVFFFPFLDSNKQKKNEVEFSPLFCCSVLKQQFFKYCKAEKNTHFKLPAYDYPPRQWIQTYFYSRSVTIWPGEPRELTLNAISDPVGGDLIEFDPYGTCGREEKIVKKLSANRDIIEIESHETTGLWTYPFLCERLLLCDQLGKNVDPDKLLSFGCEPDERFLDYYKMSAAIGTWSDYGY